MFARRVKSYMDRFSAVYGTLPAETVNNFIANMQGTDDAQTLNADAVTGELFSSFELKTVLPVFGSSALIAMGWMMVLPPYPLPPLSETLSILAKNYVGDEAWYLWAAEPVLVPAAFAFLGAYFFSLQMLIKRFMRRDLGPNAYNAVSMRIILATLGSVGCCPVDPTGGQDSNWPWDCIHSLLRSRRISVDHMAARCQYAEAIAWRIFRTSQSGGYPAVVTARWLVGLA